MDRYNNNSEDDIDLSTLSNVLRRNIKLISCFSLLGIATTSLIALTSSKEWRGEFQIVLSQPDATKIRNNQLKAITGFGSQENQLETEVEILKSPSVLMDVYEFAKSKNKSLEKLRFNDWQKRLNINLKKNTSVLNLSYVDKDKDLILPVLIEISNTYQAYSGKRRRRRIDLGIDYFTKQIELYSKKSIESMREAQNFAYEQDLSIIQTDEGMDKDIQNTINIVAERANAANQIRVIDQKLRKIKELGDSPEEIMYTASTINDSNDAGLPQILRNIDAQLTELRLIYKESDESIKDKKKERKQLISLLKRQVTGFLVAQKEDAEARFQASTRPEGVLNKYNQLLIKANKDKFTLDKLENQYRELALEKARIEDPWELITKPTLWPKPVSPKVKNLLGLGLISGFLVGCGASFFYDKKLDLIYSKRDIKLLVNTPLIQELFSDKIEYWEEYLELLVMGPFSKINGNIAVFSPANRNYNELDKIQKFLNNKLTKIDVIMTRDLIETLKYENIILVSHLGITKRKEIIDLNQQLLLQNKQFLAIFALA